MRAVEGDGRQGDGRQGDGRQGGWKQSSARVVADLGRDELDKRRVVDKGDALKGYALALVEALLGDKRVLVEARLQPLVGEVDAELLKGVVLEDLEAEDVEHTDEDALLAAHRRVDAPN